MKKIHVATNGRGFLLNLFESKINNHEFVFERSKLHEMNTKNRKRLAKIAKSNLADYLGLIQRIKVKNESADIVFSYNRFLNSKTSYVIYLENPLALVHYSTKRNKSILSKMKLKKYLNDSNLKAIICLSKACYETIRNFYSIPDSVKLEQIYPIVKNNKLTSIESIRMKCSKPNIQCLYISSNFNLKGGKDILEAFNKLKKLDKNNIKLNIITPIDQLDRETRTKIKANDNILLYDFKFSKDELNKFYNNSCILLSPTRQDSFPLVILEAIKSGNAVITTNLYALPEMVQDNYNGYLTSPKYRFFNYDSMPNELVWNNREDTIYSDYLDDEVVDFLVKKIIHLDSNRKELERMTLNSYEKAQTGEFNEEFIINKWTQIYDIIS
ncbi:glycosyltransferase family 4 protein [Senegalia sp. (in: firmicutes)]|uniref:glycosyltransferase family 4 protein n=1 Tax=Senegalia sp. (in: firmicutes) TaxID=1924098 RepID=UPI003F9B1F0F